ncbi:MAG: YbaK/EbsC family protein [Firmicutes bacterium]|nr:YbaK/EbsC family protein [Bacillota bacterium]
MNDLKRVQNFVDRFDLGLKVINHDNDTSTAEKAAETLGLEVGRIAKSLLFKIGDEEYIMVVSAGDVRINEKKFRKLFGRKPKLAKPQEVQDITGYPVGGVCPFALKTPVKIYLDSSLWRFDVVYAAAGTPSSSLPITPDELKIVTGGEKAELS